LDRAGILSFAGAFTLAGFFGVGLLSYAHASRSVIEASYYPVLMTVDPSAVTAAEPNAGAASTPPSTVGKYRLDRVIGSGGMGIVWAAFDPDLERSVALKLLHAESSEPTLRSRLLREARAMARLRHPNVVTVYEVGTDQNRDYIAMELVEGGTLDAWFETKPPRAQILEALLAAGKGLAAAHVAGLVHRDFKPHNVLRGTDGHVYVTDFGLARGQIEDGTEVVQLPLAVALDSGQRKRDSVLDSPLTQTGVLIGTPAYMAPEQFTGRVPDPKSDQFAFCVTAWEAFTGSRPFRGGTLEELEAAARGGVGEMAVDLPPRIRAVLARGLDPDPEARWPDVPSLLAALAASFAEPARPRSRRAVRIAVLLGVAAVGSGTALLLANRSSKSEQTTSACADPDAAFSRVWGDTQRGAMMANHRGGQAFGAIAVLDETRRQWVQSYARTCSSPASTTRTSRLRCLDDARDQIGKAVAPLATKGAELDISSIASLTVLVALCDPSHAGDFGEDSAIPSIPVPPLPPLPGQDDGSDGSDGSDE